MMSMETQTMIVVLLREVVGLRADFLSAQREANLSAAQSTVAGCAMRVPETLLVAVKEFFKSLSA